MVLVLDSNWEKLRTCEEKQIYLKIISNVLPITDFTLQKRTSFLAPSNINIVDLNVLYETNKWLLSKEMSKWFLICRSSMFMHIVENLCYFYLTPAMEPLFLFALNGLYWLLGIRIAGRIVLVLCVVVASGGVEIRVSSHIAHSSVVLGWNINIHVELIWRKRNICVCQGRIRKQGGKRQNSGGG